MKEKLHIKKVNPSMYSPLALAYIGDTVYDTIIRTMVVAKGDMQVNKYHKKVTGYVKAEAQAGAIALIEDRLTEGEHAVYKRGRNAKSYTSAKNASMIDYRRATGFEALIGYLYLDEQYERLVELVTIGLDLEDEPEE